MKTTRPIRVVLAKVGLDGHDRGIRVVARALRDAGMEVIYTGLWQTPQHVARAAADEDADVVGISLLSGAHMTLVPKLLEELDKQGMRRTPVIVGGVVPEKDAKLLLTRGVVKIFGPGSNLDEVVQFIREQVDAIEQDRDREGADDE